MNSGKQEHEGDSPDTLHCEFGPQGDGSHGFVGTTTAVSSKNIILFSVCVFTVLVLKLTNYLASSKRIPSISRWTATNRVMVYNLAYCINTASSWARVYAFLIYTRLIQRTFGTYYTFWSAIWRSTYKTRHARTYGLLIYFSALAVSSAR